MKVKVKSLSHARLLATPWTSAYQAPLSVGFSRQEYWSGLPLPPYVLFTNSQISTRRMFIGLYIYIYTHCVFQLCIIVYPENSIGGLVAMSFPTLVTPWTVATRLLCSWNFPDRNVEVSSHFLLQGIFPTQLVNRHLQHCRRILY